MAEEIDESLLEKCITTLEGARSDTEIFSALLIVTKIIKADNVDRSICKKIYQAVGFDTLERMLTTSESGDGCPDFMYKSVAFTLLSSFCMEEEFILNENMDRFFGHFKEALLSNPTDTDKQFMVSDAMQCICSMLNFESSRRRLIDHGIVTCLSEMVESRFYYYEEAVNSIAMFTKSHGEELWVTHTDALYDVLQRVAFDFRDDQNERKFELCNILFELLMFAVNAINTGNIVLKKEWIAAIHKGLSDILRSRIAKEQRDPALLLLSIMIECFGAEWLLQAGTDKDKKFVIVVVHIVCIEIRMTLESDSIGDIIKESLIMTSCYTILEKLIMAVTSGDYVLGLDHKQSIQFISAMTGAFKAVMKFLSDVNKARESNEISNVNDSELNSMVMASFRVLCSWLAEETSTVKEDVDSILPVLFKLAQDNLNLKKCFDDKEHIDIMRFFLAPLCHFSAEDSSRLIMLEHKFHLIIFSYLENIWKKFVKTSHCCDEIEAAIATICGIFMNIIILQSDFIVKEDVFYSLFTFIIKSLPQFNNKKDHLVLRANFAVLGLVLMKHFVSKVNSNEMIMYKYLSATLKFLWDAHNVDDSQDHATLVINIDYRRAWEDINELWFLGMQGLSSVLHEVPWICDFILESGWTQELMSTFSKVNAGAIEGSIKYTFESFLCCLVKSNSHGDKFSNAIREKDGLRICQVHEFAELKKLLC